MISTGRSSHRLKGKLSADQLLRKQLFGDVPLQKLTQMALEQHFDSLLVSGGRKTAEHPDGGPLSPKTVREIAALVSQALDKAVKEK